MRPVREAPGGVVRTDDEARPHDERAVAECLLDDPLAAALRAPYVGVVVLLVAGCELMRRPPPRARVAMSA